MSNNDDQEQDEQDVTTSGGDLVSAVLKGKSTLHEEMAQLRADFEQLFEWMHDRGVYGEDSPDDAVMQSRSHVFMSPTESSEALQEGLPAFMRSFASTARTRSYLPYFRAVDAVLHHVTELCQGHGVIADVGSLTTRVRVMDPSHAAYIEIVLAVDRVSAKILHHTPSGLSQILSFMEADDFSIFTRDALQFCLRQAERQRAAWRQIFALAMAHDRVVSQEEDDDDPSALS